MKKSLGIFSVVAMITLGIALSFNLIFTGAKNNPTITGTGNRVIGSNQVKIVDSNTESMSIQ